MFGQTPNVIDVAPALFARPRPGQVISAIMAIGSRITLSLL